MVNQLLHKDYHIYLNEEQTAERTFGLKKGRLQPRTKKNFFTMRVARHRQQVANRSCGCPIIGSVQDQVGQAFEQPDLVEAVPTHGKGVGLDDL